MEERLQKIISAHGVVSRRRAEELIKKGLVKVNGETAYLGMKADDEIDEITINGEPLKAKDGYIYIMLNKPAGYVTTMHDEYGRPTVYDLVAGASFRVYPVGRLDKDSEGLLLMTNDGNFANYIMHPSNEKQKTYEVAVEGNIEEAVPLLRKPMFIDGYRIKPAEVEVKQTKENGAVLTVTIHEGRNRQVRKMCSAAALKVLRLKRVSIAGLSLGNLKTGEWRYLSEKERQLFYEK